MVKEEEYLAAISVDSESYPTFGVLKHFGIKDEVGKELIFRWSALVVGKYTGRHPQSAFRGRDEWSSLWKDIAKRWPERKDQVAIKAKLYDNHIRAYESRTPKV